MAREVTYRLRQKLALMIDNNTPIYQATAKFRGQRKGTIETLFTAQSNLDKWIRGQDFDEASLSALVSKFNAFLDDNPIVGDEFRFRLALTDLDDDVSRYAFAKKLGIDESWRDVDRRIDRVLYGRKVRGHDHACKDDQRKVLEEFTQATDVFDLYYISVSHGESERMLVRAAMRIRHAVPVRGSYGDRLYYIPCKLKVPYPSTKPELCRVVDYEGSVCFKGRDFFHWSFLDTDHERDFFNFTIDMDRRPRETYSGMLSSVTSKDWIYASSVVLVPKVVQDGRESSFGDVRRYMLDAPSVFVMEANDMEPALLALQADDPDLAPKTLEALRVKLANSPYPMPPSRYQ